MADVVPNFEFMVDPTALADVPLFSRTHDQDVMAKYRTIYWFRRPDDCLYSYYSMLTKRQKTKSLEHFVRGVGPTWVAHINKALRMKSKKPRRILLNDYSDYLVDPTSVMRRMAAFARLDVEDAIDNIVAQENRFFRKGKFSKPDDVQSARGADGHAADNYTGELRDYVFGELMTKYEEIKAVASFSRDAGQLAHIPAAVGSTSDIGDQSEAAPAIQNLP